MNGCQTCGGFGDRHDDIAHEIERENAQLRQGLCPRSGKPIMPNGVLRPACAICYCGEDE